IRGIVLESIGIGKVNDRGFFQSFEAGFVLNHDRRGGVGVCRPQRRRQQAQSKCQSSGSNSKIDHPRWAECPAGSKAMLNPMQFDLPLSVDSPESKTIMVAPSGKLQSTTLIAGRNVRAWRNTGKSLFHGGCGGLQFSYTWPRP